MTTGKANFEFSDDEIEIVQFLASQLEHAEFNSFSIDFVVRTTRISEDVVRKLCVRLNNLGFIAIRDIDGNNFAVDKSIFTLRHAIENQPLPNHWQKVTDWWFSKKWTLPVSAFIVFMPLITQWIEMLKSFLSWTTPE